MEANPNVSWFLGLYIYLSWEKKKKKPLPIFVHSFLFFSLPSLFSFLGLLSIWPLFLVFSLCLGLQNPRNELGFLQFFLKKLGERNREICRKCWLLGVLLSVSEQALVAMLYSKSFRSFSLFFFFFVFFILLFWTWVLFVAEFDVFGRGINMWVFFFLLKFFFFSMIGFFGQLFSFTAMSKRNLWLCFVIVS